MEDEAIEQVRKLIQFLQPVLGSEDIRRNYVTTWSRLSADAPNQSVVDFWKNLRDTIRTQFTTYIGNSSTVLEPSERLDLYNEMLNKRVEKCLEHLDYYIQLLEDHGDIRNSPEDYGEDELRMTDKALANTSISTAKSFMDVILFMFAVPTRSIYRWDSIDPYEKVIFDFKIAPSKFYQDNETFMTFLRDCAVVLFTSDYEFPREIESIYRTYITFERSLQPSFVVPAETLSAMRDIENKELDTCRICYVNTRDVILFPCKHLIICHECAFNPLFVKDNRCPYCFTPIKQIVSVQTLAKDNKINFKQIQLPKQSICSLLTQLSTIR